MEQLKPRHFLKDLLYYGLGNMLYSLVQFFSMPLVVKSMDKAQVANWNILLPTGVLLSAIVTFGMDSAVVRYIKDAQTEKERKTIFSTGFFFETGLAILVALSMWLLAAQWLPVVKLSGTYTSSWWVLAAWLPSVIMAQYFQNWFKYNFQRSLFLSLILVQSLVYLAGILLLKLTGQVSLLNVMLVMLASQLLVAMVGFYFCRHLLVAAVNTKLLGRLLLYGIPFMALAFGYNFIGSVDRYLLAGNVSDEYFAVYTQAFRISAIISMVVSSFNFAFGPFLLSLLGREEAPATLSRFHTYYLMAMCVAGLCFLALARVIITLLAGYDYTGGQSFMLFFVTGYIFYGMYSFAQAGIIHSRKSYLGLFALAGGLATVFLVDLLSVSRYEGLGTAGGFMLANIVMVVLAAIFSAKYVPVRYQFIKDLSLLALFFGGGILLLKYTLSANMFVDGGVKLLLVIGIAGSLLYVMLPGSDRVAIRSLLAGRKIPG